MARPLATAAAFLALVVPVAAGVDTPQGGWYSGSPELGPNDLLDVACADRACYAAGAFGTLLRGGNGSAWQGARTGLTESLLRVRVIRGDPQKLVVGGRCLLRRSDDGGVHFRRLAVLAAETGCIDRISAFSFPSSDVGFVALSDGTVLRTGDGGAHWSRRTRVFAGTSGQITDSVDDLLCVTTTRCFAVLRQGQVLRSGDGGQSWKAVGSTVDSGTAVVPAHAITFADERTGYTGGAGVFLKTVDGGDTWQRHAVPGSEDLLDVSCRPGDPGTCLFVTTAGDHLLRTTDGGQTFTTIALPLSGAAAVAFTSAGQAVVAGANGTAAYSDDAGVTWTQVGHALAGDYRALEAVSPSVAVAAGTGGALARTRDSGRTWSAVNLPTASDVRDVASSDGRTIYALDSANRVRRSTDGGKTYETLPHGRTPLSALATLPGRRVLLVGRHAALLSANGGDSFAAVRLDLVKGDVLSAVDRAGAGTLLYGPRTLLVSSDRARTWRHMRLPRMGRHDAIGRVDFVAPRVGYLLSGERRLFSTSDAGHHWREIVSTGGGGADMSFSDRLHGFLAVPGYAYRFSGAVLRTSNGGVTWHPQVVSPGFLQAVAARGSTAYALTADAGGSGGGSALFATRSGGDAGLPSLVSWRASARRVRAGGRVTLHGRLSPRGDRTQLVVSGRAAGRWISRVVALARDGTWRSVWKLTRTTTFVVQALADSEHAGAGTRPLTVGLRQKRH